MGVPILALGVLLLAVAGVTTRVLVKREFGVVSEASMEEALAWRTVPKWISLLGLCGWALIAIGVLVLIFG